jgi:deazaflavin-dependent oxidoreductase (nitroreductase family)
MPAGGNPRLTLVGSLRTQLETGTAEELMTTVDYNAFTRQLMADIRENGRPTSGPMAGRPLMILTTKGAKSGEPRSAVVTYTRDRDRYVIAASKGGAPTHPAWYFNLLAHPGVNVEADKETFEATARVTDGEERQRLWDQHAAERPEFRDYPEKTSRVIPDNLLERAS